MTQRIINVWPNGYAEATRSKVAIQILSACGHLGMDRISEIELRRYNNLPAFRIHWRMGPYAPDCVRVSQLVKHGVELPRNLLSHETEDDYTLMFASYEAAVVTEVALVEAMRAVHIRFTH